MLPEIETPRLAVRLARPGMQSAIARFLEVNFAGHLDRWSPPPAPAFFTVAFWAERLTGSVEEFHSDRAVRFVLQPREADLDRAPVLGTCNYTNIVRGAFHGCHLGYQIARSHQGQGLMEEALRAANAFMFDAMRMHRIMANYRPENERSRRLLERLGFEHEGLARNYLFIDGAWRDHVLTSLTHPRYDDAWLAGDGRVSRVAPPRGSP
ncbi:MAG: GNAT family N-acetyltransferase [Pseudomonadota bacterium]|nr:GNAT family N-acetyltransferase [Pseudomonadota bacterium]